MLIASLLLLFVSIVALILSFMPGGVSNRPKLMLDLHNDPITGLTGMTVTQKNKTPLEQFINIIRKLAFFNTPLAITPTGRRIYRQLGMAKLSMTVEEFFLIKEILIVGLMALVIIKANGSDFFVFLILMSFAIGYMGPELWLNIRTAKIKDSILRELPDTVDLLGLCVNAGLDFMMALKYVVDKANPTVLIDELRNMMQEINVGKSRRDALRDLSRKYEMPDLSTFSRTLIQADRMGTSVSEALNILSEDMRETRFRRGEAMALKAPLKMLVPLLFFIFPVVAILVAGPIFLDFFQNNPMDKLGK